MLFNLKVLQAKERTPTFSPSVVFTFGLIVEFIKEFRGASQFMGWAITCVTKYHALVNFIPLSNVIVVHCKMAL
jgi:hypothetical protein